MPELSPFCFSYTIGDRRQYCLDHGYGHPVFHFFRRNFHGGSVLNLRLAHNSQALFMFESRNPPPHADILNPVTIVLEPSSSLLGLVAGLALA
jgi:hypothetical protein